ncbi:MAG TPA: hypothetical protein VF454_00615 [Gemmatimonadales bacterium]
MRTLRILALLAAVGLASSCGGDGGPHAQPGVLTLTLNTPNVDDGALLFRVVGGPVDSVAGGVMVQDGSYTVQPSYTRIVVAGDITDGVVAGVYIPDVHDASSYSVVMEQVAVRNTFAQRSIGGYSIAVSAP